VIAFLYPLTFATALGKERRAKWPDPQGSRSPPERSTTYDVREQFLARCVAKNLSPRTLEWYEDRTGRFAEWCSAQGIKCVTDLAGGDVDAFLIELRREGLAPQTVRGFAQVVKTLSRFAHRHGLIAIDSVKMPGESGEAVKTSPDVSSSRAFPSWSARRAGRARSLTVRCLPCNCRRAESPPRAVLGTATRTGRSARPRNRRDRHA
jgi:hypothetical protein